jgi:hypothetical protein
MHRRSSGAEHRLDSAGENLLRIPMNPTSRSFHCVYLAAGKEIRMNYTSGGGNLMMVRLNSSLDFLSLSGGIVEISHFQLLSLNFQRHRNSN